MGLVILEHSAWLVSSAMWDSQSQHSEKPQDGDEGSIDVGCRQSVVKSEYSGDSFSL